MARIAVVGSGIAGLTASWLLAGRHQVTLFEANEHLGGHSRTVDVSLGEDTCPVDAGFLVFNRSTYPNLTAMLEYLGVPTTPTEMTFSVSLEQPAIGWASSHLPTVFGQKRNLLRPRFWGMLYDALRFNRESVAWLAANSGHALTLREYLLFNDYSTAFAEWYLLPMASSIWSCPTDAMLDMPMANFVRLCENHGLLQNGNRPQWRIVKGGSREYVRRLAADLDDIRIECPVTAVRPLGNGVEITHGYATETFDRVVLACHAHQSLTLLGEHASAGQRDVLASVRYQSSRAVLHTDARLLPGDRKLWSAWNYLAAATRHGQAPVSVSYIVNKLQPLPFSQPVIISFNPLREPARETILAQFDHAYPMLDHMAFAAQRRLPGIQGEGNVWLCGAWRGHGFHEDGVNAALAVANGMGVHAPWQVAHGHRASRAAEMA
jgi:predicted NAD/FAD-binding protein